MDKILVTIYVLSIEHEFDVFLPIGETVSNVLDLIQDSLVDLSNNNYIKKENVFLYDNEGNIINPNNIIKYSGLKNGEKVCLM